MILPELPKKNNKDEADFGLKFRKWIEKNPQIAAPYELKDTRGKDYFSFSELSEEQIQIALKAKSDKGVLIRIQKGTIGAPDYVYYRNSPYWIVIHYPKKFEIVDIETLLLEKARNKRKSLTWERAKAISVKSV